MALREVLSGFARLARDTSGWKRFGLAFFAGAFSVLAHAPFDLWPVLFLTLPILVWLIDGVIARAGEDKRRLARRAFSTGWAFGFGYFLFGLYWIANAFLVDAQTFAALIPFAMTIMPAGLAVFYALTIAGAALIWKPGLARLLTLALALAIAEWLRGTLFTGFPWNALGYAFAGEAGLSQLFSVFGPYALTLIAVLLFTTPVLALNPDKPALNLRPFLTALVILTVAGIMGHWRLMTASAQNVEGITLRLVQPNIDQKEKWANNAGPIYRTMLRLSRMASPKSPRGLTDVSHLIWPEAALPFLMARSKEALEGIDTLLPDNVTLITGAMRAELPSDNKDIRQRRIYNSLYVLNGKAQITRTYDKKHLVPFGEYLPFQDFLESIGLQQLTKIRGGFALGKGPRLVKTANAPPFSALICYEVVFPGEVIEPGERPKWLLNVTNDAWYGRSTGPYQHLAQSRIRAIETGLPMVRANNTGVSAVIGPYGRIRHALPLGVEGIIDAPLPQSIAPPLQARHGSALFALLLLLAALLNLRLVHAQRPRNPQR